jgi:parvulin-like peptidyl-prolyl isomerase
VQDAFGIVLVVVVVLAAIVAIVTFFGTGRAYEQIGRGGLSLNEDDDRGRPVSAAVSRAVADEEIRQMLGARNARREARGEAPLDIDAELARLTAPAVDPQLESEIRALVIARNERRERQGKPPLDVEDEVRRQIAELGGL